MSILPNFPQAGLLPMRLIKMILFHLMWVRPGDVRDGLAPPQVLNAVPSSAFSAPAELAPLFIDIARKSLAPLGLSVCPVQAQTSSAPRGSLEGRFRKAKPSMVASALPNSAFEPTHIKWKRSIKINPIRYENDIAILLFKLV